MAVISLVESLCASAFVVHPTTLGITVHHQQRRQATRTTPLDAAKGSADGTREEANQPYLEDGSNHGDDDDPPIHPSAAWLNDVSMNPSSGKKSTWNMRRTLSVDYGTNRVGLAIGVGISPRTIPGISNRGSDLDVVRQVLLRARGEGIRDIVVGLPLLR